jgi:hypothetical protein
MVPTWRRAEAWILAIVLWVYGSRQVAEKPEEVAMTDPRARHHARFEHELRKARVYKFSCAMWR